MRKARVLAPIAVLAAIGGLVYTQGSGAAGDEKAVRAAVEKIAAAVEKGDMEGARKHAETLAKKTPGDPLEVLEELGAMDLFKKKDKGGFGFGAGPKELDGIEVKYREIARDGATPASVKNDAKHYKAMGYRTAAIGLVAEALTPKKAKGTAQPKNWVQYTKDIVEGGEALAKAKSAAEVKTIATRVNNACNACHSEWRNK